MDDWDPAVINGFARERDVILFDNAGVGRFVRRDPQQRPRDGRSLARFS